MAIIVRTQGGLGNQLFQYAFGRGVASRFKTELLIDRTTFDDPAYNPHKIHRPYSLGHFNAPVRFAKNSDLLGFVWLRKHYRFFDMFYKYLRGKNVLLPFYYPEQTFAFDPRIFATQRRHTYFDGYWQTEKYFAHIKDELRKELTLARPLSAYSQTVSDEIKKTRAVSLHVRRGDYITDPMAASYHGICSMEYYQRAIAHIAARVPSPHFFIFSDDYAWSLENFKSLGYAYTCVVGEKDYEDLMLMAACEHHIIANSSMGWWGAWLNPAPDKIVIAPKIWFANAPKADTRDTIPDNWITM